MKLIKKTHKIDENGGISIAGECSSGENAGGKTVIVGIRLDQESKQLLTWALMKIAHPGDRLLALHVLHHSSTGLSNIFFWANLINFFDFGFLKLIVGSIYFALTYLHFSGF